LRGSVSNAHCCDGSSTSTNHAAAFGAAAAGPQLDSTSDDVLQAVLAFLQHRAAGHGASMPD
jgi:hypothetical protein